MTDLRDSYEDLERAVCDQVPVGLKHIPDSVDKRIDARLEEPLRPVPPVIATADPGSAVEIKTCQVRKGSGTFGSWIFHGGQHTTLEELEGIYVLAVLDELDVERWAVSDPPALNPLLRWHDCPGTPGYHEQASVRWPEVLGDVQWSARGREGRRPIADGGNATR